MTFRDAKIWSIWILWVAFLVLLVVGIIDGCKDIASRQGAWSVHYHVIVEEVLYTAVFSGLSMKVIQDYLSKYRIDEKGFQSHSAFQKEWTLTGWEEISHCRHYRRWTGEMENFIYFANYELIPDRPKAPMNSGEYRYTLFLVPLSRKGLKAIQRYVPDEQLRMLANDPWLWKSKYAKQLYSIFKERAIFRTDTNNAADMNVQR